MDRFRPEAFLPLTPIAFAILVALADGERHGYSVLQEIESQSGAALHAGTLYRALARLLESRLIDEIDAPAAAGTADERRRYYRLTDRGIAVARAETQRLEAQLAAARSRRLLRARP
jgi:DNA-binding PadR family transcriptional regulator